MSLTVKDDKCSLFAWIGFVVVSYYGLRTLLRLVNNIGTFFLGTGAVNLKKFGSWAVVTGCTDGIGKAYAQRLAKQGLNVVLISRSADKLKELSDELTKKYSIQTKVISADFTGNFSPPSFDSSRHFRQSSRYNLALITAFYI